MRTRYASVSVTIEAEISYGGYGRFGGSRATAQDITTVFDVMEANGLLTQERLLTGTYRGSLSARYSH